MVFVVNEGWGGEIYDPPKPKPTDPEERGN